MKLHESSFLYAILKFVTILVLLYFIKKIYNKKKELIFSDFLLINVSKYSSISILIVFLLTLFKAYNLFNYLFLLFFFLIYDLNNFNPPSVIYFKLKNSFEKLSLNAIHVIEKQNKQKIISDFLKKKKINKNEIYDLISIILIICFSMIVKIYFYSNDLFLFSELWFNHFQKINEILDQQWFNVEYIEKGQFALISIFSLFFKVSSGMSLQTFGVLQNIILSILIYWIVRKVSTKDKILIPLLSALIFISAFTLAPVDITLAFKHRKIFTALFIFLPVLIALTKKQHFYSYRKNLIYTFLAILSLSLTNYSVLFIVILPACVLFFIFDTTKKKKLKVIPLVLLVFVMFFTLILQYCLFNHGDFNLNFFLKNSFIEISSFNKIQNLKFPYENIIKYTSVIGTIIIIVNILKNNISIISKLICSIYLVIAGFYHTKYYLIDENLSLLIFAFLTPTVFGIFIVEFFFNNLNWISYKNVNYFALCIILCSTSYLIHYQKDDLSNLKITNETNRQILSAYDNIITNHLPYSYAIINHEKAVEFSKKNHFFINYNELNNEYLIRDSIYHENKNRKDFFKYNPHRNLPNSIFLFETLPAKKNVSRIVFLTSKKQLKKNEHIINVLKSRDREVQLYINTDKLRVYKITNKKNSSNIDDMLFYDKRL